MSAPTAWLVHGVNVTDGGAGSIDRLGPYLKAAGWRVGQFDYGWRIVTHAWGNPEFARRLASMAGPDDIIVGHSNGCVIGDRASWLPWFLPERMFYINPALDVHRAPGPGVKSLTVFHSWDDVATLLARFVPGSRWGSMGRDGYRGKDPRITNVELHELLHAGAADVGHSGAFARINQFGPSFISYAGRPT